MRQFSSTVSGRISGYLSRHHLQGQWGSALKQLCLMLIVGLLFGVTVRPAAADVYLDEAFEIASGLHDAVAYGYGSLIEKDSGLLSNIKDLRTRANRLNSACPMGQQVKSPAIELVIQSEKVVSWARDTYAGRVSGESKGRMADDLARIKSNLRAMARGRMGGMGLVKRIRSFAIEEVTA